MFSSDGHSLSHWHIITACEDGRCRIHKVEKDVSIIDNIHSFRLEGTTCRITLESVIEVTKLLLSSVEPHPVMMSSDGGKDGMWKGLNND